METKEVKHYSLIETDEKLMSRLKSAEDKATQMEYEMRKDQNTGEMAFIGADHIGAYLSVTPDLIAEFSLYEANVERDYSYAKNDTSTIKSVLWIECNQRRDELKLTNAEDRKSWVQIQPKYQAAVKREMEWKYILQRVQTILDRYNNIFMAYRKIANMVELDQSNNYRREKYSNY